MKTDELRERIFKLLGRVEELEKAHTEQAEVHRAAQMTLSSISSGWKLGCVEAEAERDRYREALERVGNRRGNYTLDVGTSPWSFPGLGVYNVG